MKKLIILLGVLTVSLTSCLKDKPNVDFSNIGAFTEFVHAGTPYFGSDAITDPGTGSDLSITTTFQVNITGVNPPTSDVKITIGVDNSVIAPYNAANTAVNYLQMPDGSFTLPTTTATIKAGTRLATFTVTFLKAKLDPALSYMLPVKILSSSIGISGNFNIHYFHFIGNDFAGAYLWNYTRTPASGNFVGQPTTIYPVTPAQFEVTSGYVGPRYEVTFTKTGNGASALYSNFAVKLNPDDVAGLFLAQNGINVTVAASFASYDPSHKYTFAEATHGLFDFKYNVTNGAGAPRAIEDKYYKP